MQVSSRSLFLKYYKLHLSTVKTISGINRYGWISLKDCLSRVRGGRWSYTLIFPKLFRFKVFRPQQVGNHLKFICLLLLFFFAAIMLQSVRPLTIISFYFTYAIIFLEERFQLASLKQNEHNCQFAFKIRLNTLILVLSNNI